MRIIDSQTISLSGMHVGRDAYGVSRLCRRAVCLPVRGGAEECPTSTHPGLVLTHKVTLTSCLSCWGVWFNVDDLLTENHDLFTSMSLLTRHQLICFIPIPVIMNHED